MPVLQHTHFFFCKFELFGKPVNGFCRDFKIGENRFYRTFGLLCNFRNYLIDLSHNIGLIVFCVVSDFYDLRLLHRSGGRLNVGRLSRVLYELFHSCRLLFGGLMPDVGDLFSRLFHSLRRAVKSLFHSLLGNFSRLLHRL